MKKILFLIITLLVGTKSYSQFDFFNTAPEVYIYGDYNLSKINCSGLNFVIDRYNQTRTSLPLSKTMEHLENINGWGGGIGLSMQRTIFFELGYNYRKGTVSAELTEAGARTIREVRQTIGTFSFVFGGFVTKSPFVDLTAGGGFDFGTTNYSTRKYIDGSSVPDFSDIQNTDNFVFGVTPFIEMHITPPMSAFEFVVKPYYQFHILKTDFSNLNQAINPNTYLGDNSDDQKGAVNNYGIEFRLVIKFGKSLF